MPDSMGPTKKFKYLIRPDGTIRVSTKGSITPLDTDHVVLLTERYHPSRYFWDFDISQMVAYSDEQLAERRRVKLDARAEERASVAAKKARLAHLMSTLSREQAEVVALVAELGGVSLD